MPCSAPHITPFNHRLKNQREPNNNNRSQGYEDHYAFMATMVDPNTDAPGEDDKSVDPSRAPVRTPGTNQKIFQMEMEEELYEETRKMYTVLQKLGNFLRAPSVC
jgi:hypothetical protein